jgi:hypothetical protein
MQSYTIHKIKADDPIFCLMLINGIKQSKLNKINFNELLKYFDENSVKSTVGIKKQNVINENMRKSKIISDIVINLINSEDDEIIKFNESVKLILPEKYSIAEYEIPYSGYSSVNRWDMLVYDKNDFFIKHTDGKLSDRHYATLLLLPPKKINNFTGGDLIIYSINEPVTINADLNNWQLIMFPIDIYHECTKILTGRRIIFKSKFEIPTHVFELDKFKNSNYGIFKETPSNPITSDNQIKDKAFNEKSHDSSSDDETINDVFHMFDY